VLLLLPVILTLACVGASLVAGPGPVEQAKRVLTPEIPTAAMAAARPSGSGTLVLDLAQGRFDVLPADPGQPLTVEGDYDAAAYELTTSVEDRGEAGWTCTVRFGRKPGVMPRLFGHAEDDGDNSVRIRVPRDQPVAIAGKVRMGASELELGGLSVTSIDLETSMGEHEVTFSEPTPAPVELVRLKGSMGETRVQHLGNASPLEAKLAHQLGALRVDLDGPWRNGCALATRFRFGECRVRAPEGLLVVVESAHVSPGEADVPALQRQPSAEEALRAIRVTVEGGFGQFTLE
jgi:hypothetical protein